MNEKIAVETRLQLSGSIFYDIETVCCPPPSEGKKQGISYCSNWDDFANMGVSVIVAYDFVEAAYRVFLHDNFAQFQQLIDDSSIVIGFNNQGFDDKVISYCGMNVPSNKSYDLYREITRNQPYGQGCSFSLNSLLMANGIPMKSGHGKDAPELAQTGKWGALINYCLDDVRKSVQLLRLTLAGCLKHPGNGSIIEINKPWEKM